MGAVQVKCQGPPGCAWSGYAPSDPLELEVLPALGSGGLPRGGRARTRSPEWLGDHELRMRELVGELFQLHDLDGDGALQEAELIRLNEQIALLHHGDDADLGSVRKRYRELFRSCLSANGEPASCEAFSDYTRKVLDAMDTDPVAQELILEQWSLEAQACRQLFPPAEGCSVAASPRQVQGPPDLAQKSHPAESDHDLPSTVGESLADSGTESDSDILHFCSRGRDIMLRGSRRSDASETDGESSSLAVEEEHHRVDEAESTSERLSAARV
mmetsp:Transcript_13567/g.38568  ORF Transcript_13567/g.38568 Transcript_13567/m.38568 type:complete len:272 (-) Transcript_13567:146-961(-)